MEPPFFLEVLWTLLSTYQDLPPVSENQIMTRTEHHQNTIAPKLSTRTIFAQSLHKIQIIKYFVECG